MLATGLSLSACDDVGLFVRVGDGVRVVLQVIVEPDSADVRVGQTRTFRARSRTERGDTTNLPVRWSSIDPGVASVEPERADATRATGRAPGTTTIVATEEESGRADSARLVVGK